MTLIHCALLPLMIVAKCSLQTDGTKHLHFKLLCMNKLQLTGQNLGQVFNSRGGHVYAMHSWGYLSKLHNLKQGILKGEVSLYH
jgi:hypothetical protein